MAERQSRELLELLVDPGMEAIERTRLRVLQHFGPIPGFGDSLRTVYAVEIVLEEWLTNVFRHGTGSPVALRVSVDADGILMRFVDDGPPFDATERPLPARPSNLDEARPGGLGLFLIHHYAKSWHCARQDGRNVMHIAIDTGRR